MKKISALLILLAWFCILPLAIQAEENCSKNVICLHTTKSADKISLTASNLVFCDVTVTIEFSELVNMECDRALPYTETLAGKTETVALALRIKDPSRAYHWQYNYYWTYGSIYAKHDPAAVYVLPYPEGKSYRVIQGFGGTFSHTGDQYYAIDWDMPEGAEVCAARAGMVVGIQDSYTKGGVDKKYLDMANYVMIKQTDGTIGEYDHFKYKGVAVNVGQQVNAGDVIGYAGSVGYSSGPHLHFIVYRALDGKTRESLPINFYTEAGVVVLEQGQIYTNRHLIKDGSSGIDDTPASISDETSKTTATIGKIHVITNYSYQGKPAVCFKVTDVTVHGKLGQEVHFGFNIWQDQWLEWVGLAAQPLPYADASWQDAGSFYYPHSLLAEKGDKTKPFSGCFFIVDTLTNQTIARECVTFSLP